jgi:hypothetical protein
MLTSSCKNKNTEMNGQIIYALFNLNFEEKYLYLMKIAV